jgi:hypothetical protein
MASDKENNFNQALELLKKGVPVEEILQKFELSRAELKPQLELAAGLLRMPKVQVPEPAMQRKYALAPSKRFWVAWIHISKFASAGVALMLIVSCLGATGYAAASSAPGTLLFSLRKVEEHIRLTLTANQVDRANFQVAIAQNRLSQAQIILNNPSSGVQQQTLALNELASQTTSAVAELNQVAQNDPKSNQNNTLINTLDSITTQQMALLSNIKSGQQISAAANQALQELKTSTSQLNAISESVAMADSEQSLTTLNPNSNSVAVLGTITQVNIGQITVEKTTFTLTPQTIITDASGNTLAIQNLTQNEKVNVIGIQNQTSLVAQQILVTQSPQAQLIGAQASSTPTTTSQSLLIAGEKSTSLIPAAELQNFSKSASGSRANASASTTQTNPDTATGGVIFDNPSPQFAN